MPGTELSERTYRSREPREFQTTCVGSAMYKPRLEAVKAAVTDGLIEGTVEAYESEAELKEHELDRLKRYCCEV